MLAHTVPLIGVHGTARRIDRNLLEVCTEAPALCIGISKETSLQQFIRRGTDSRNEITRRECELFHFCKIIFRIAVQNHFSDLLKWEIRMVPDFCHIERIEFVILRLFRCHDLDVKSPRGIISTCDGFVKIARRMIWIRGGELLRLLCRECMKTEIRLEMIFHPNIFAFCIVPKIGVTGETVIFPVVPRCSAVGKKNRDLVQGFRRK